MQIVIQRNRISPSSIDGTLLINDQRVCDTAEWPATAIPAGEYTIRLRYCSPYHRRMMLIVPRWAPEGAMAEGQWPVFDPELATWTYEHRRWPFPDDYEAGPNSLMPFVCPMLKPGNGVRGRADGSIILGERLQPGVMLHPVKTYARLYARIRQSIHRGHEVFLTIV